MRRIISGKGIRFLALMVFVPFVPGVMPTGGWLRVRAAYADPQATTNFAVVNSGTSAYLVDGVATPR